MITCTRRLQFAAGHRVMLHESKCRHLHGHNYVAFITAQAPQLDRQGRVVDFATLKEQFGGWIDRNWDHGFILSKDDIAGLSGLQNFALLEWSATELRLRQNIEYPAGSGLYPCAQKIYLMPSNPTAENMAHHLLYTVAAELKLPEELTIVKVVLHETENCYAEVCL